MKNCRYGLKPHRSKLESIYADDGYGNLVLSLGFVDCCVIDFMFEDLH